VHQNMRYTPTSLGWKLILIRPLSLSLLTHHRGGEKGGQEEGFPDDNQIG